MRRRLLGPSWAAPNLVLRLWIPAAYGAFLVGLSVSIIRFFEGRTIDLEDAIISDLLSPDNNPRGCLFAAVAISVCGFLLLPAAALFLTGWNHPHRSWVSLGAGFYLVGLIAMVAIGFTTPFQEPYVPVHIWLAFAALIGLVAGLALCLGAAAWAFPLTRVPLEVFSALHLGALLFLVILAVGPGGLLDRRFLAACEWLLNALIAAGTAVFVAVLNSAPRQSAKTEGR